MKKLSDTKFAIGIILLLMMLGAFLVGCAHDTDKSEVIYQESADSNGDGKEQHEESIPALLYETENVNEEETTGQNSEEADDGVEEFSMDEIEELFFGEWEVTKLLGFTEIQNDYTNYPKGHDIIGDHIVINEDVFSSEGLEKYERYQCEVLEPSYEVSPIKERYLIYYVSEAVKEDPELYDWILNHDEFQNLEIRGTRDGIKRRSPAVDIMISSDKQSVILTMDCAFYLLEKIMFSGCGKQDAEQEVQVYYWNNRGNDVLTSEMKIDSQSEDSFVRNFLETYNADIETKEEFVDVAGIKMFSYKTADENTVFVFQEPVPNSTEIKRIGTLINRDGLEKYDRGELDFTRKFLARDFGDYIFQRESYEDYIKISYRDNVDYCTDSGSQYYDPEGHILYWEYYLTSGDRSMYFVWENDKVKWIVDTGGMPFGTDPEDSTVFTGMETQLYYFEPTISVEKLPGLTDAVLLWQP